MILFRIKDFTVKILQFIQNISLVLLGENILFVNLAKSQKS